MTKLQLAAIALAAGALGASGCAAPAGKSGGAEGVDLDLAVAGYPGTPSAALAQRFAGRVEALSKGAVAVSIEYEAPRFAPTTPAAQVDASTVGALRSGQVQLAIAPDEAWVTAGATTLGALQVPYLITSLPAADRGTSGRLADRLEAGLGRLGLTGLGLVPEGLYRAFGFLKPLETPADFAGLTVRAPASRAAYALLRSLGARPVDAGAEGVNTALRSGFAPDPRPLTAAGDRFPAEMVAASNVVFFPNVDVIAARSGSFDLLPRAARSALLRAAVEARAETIAGIDERAAAAAYCLAGGTLETAPRFTLRALRARSGFAAELRGNPLAGLLQMDRRGTMLRPCSPAGTRRYRRGRFRFGSAGAPSAAAAPEWELPRGAHRCRAPC